MKKILLLSVCSSLLAGELRALPFGGASPQGPAPKVHRYYYSVSGGAAVPIGGHWGDADAGFKLSPAFAVAGAKKVDETLSYGLETSYATGHKSRNVSDMRVRIFSLTPFLRAAYQSAGRISYGLLGAGIYHWTQPSLRSAGAAVESDSGSSFGINMGGGVIYPLWSDVQIGFDMRWHHIFTMRGDNFDVDLANNIVPSVIFLYGF